MLVHAVLVLILSLHFFVNRLCRYDEDMVISVHDIRPSDIPLGHCHAYY